MATPVFNVENEIVGSLTVVGPARRFDELDLWEPLGELVRRRAACVTRRLATIQAREPRRS